MFCVSPSSIYKAGSGPPCTKNIPHLHTLGPQFWFWTTLYEKHTTSTYTRTPILHVRKTYHIYIHSNLNSLCTRNTRGPHTQLTQLFMYVNTPGLHMRNYQSINQTRGPPHPSGGPPNHIASPEAGLHAQCTRSLCRGTHLPHPLPCPVPLAPPLFTLDTAFDNERGIQGKHIIIAHFLPGLPLFSATI